MNVVVKKWNLDDIYKIDQFENKVKEIKALMKEWEKLWSEIDPKMSEDKFREILIFDENLEEKISKLIYLPHLLESIDQKDQKAKLLKTKSNDIAIEYNKLTRKFGHWIKGKKVEGKNILDDKNAKRLFDSEFDLKYILERSRLAEKHTLTENEEEIINNKDISGIEALKDIRGLIETDIKYKFKDKIIETQSELLQHIYSDKKEDRKEAYISLLTSHKENIDKFFLIYQSVVKDWAFETKIRNFESPITVRNFANNISDKSIETLLSVCKKNVYIFQKFFKYKAKKIGTGTLSRFDVYAPITSNNENKINYEESINLVISSFEKFSKKFANNAKKIIDSNHIDNLPGKNKRSGAFCATVSPKIEPYILLNYIGNNRDLFTLAHELGHGVHSIYAKNHYPSSQHANLPLAETASTLGEMIVMEKLLELENNKEKRLKIISEKMADSYATIIRQNYFILFEIKAHELLKKGATEKELSELWMETLKDQFGSSVDIDNMFRYEWAYVSHIFESPFYCYAYNFGELLTMSLYKRYKDNPKFATEIEKLLSIGGSISPEVALKNIGVNTEDENFWQGGFEIIKKWQEELDNE